MSTKSAISIKDQLSAMDAIISEGAIVDAVKEFFANDATKSDYRNAATGNKSQMVEKMENFAGSIAKANGITLHHSIAEGNVSASEFTLTSNEGRYQNLLARDHLSNLE